MDIIGQLLYFSLETVLSPHAAVSPLVHLSFVIVYVTQSGLPLLPEYFVQLNFLQIFNGFSITLQNGGVALVQLSKLLFNDLFVLVDVVEGLRLVLLQQIKGFLLLFNFLHNLESQLYLPFELLEHAFDVSEIVEERLLKVLNAHHVQPLNELVGCQNGFEVVPLTYVLIDQRIADGHIQIFCSLNFVLGSKLILILTLHLLACLQLIVEDVKSLRRSQLSLDLVHLRFL